MKKLIQVFIIVLMSCVTPTNKLFAEGYLVHCRDLLFKFHANGRESLDFFKTKATQYLTNGTEQLLDLIEQAGEFINFVEEDDEHFYSKKIILTLSLVLFSVCLGKDFGILSMQTFGSFVQDLSQFLCNDEAWIQLCMDIFGDTRESCSREFTTSYNCYKESL